MPQIIVIADPRSDRGEGAVMLRERVNLSDFESRHFAHQLVERLGWAVEDAHEHETAFSQHETALGATATTAPDEGPRPSETGKLALAATAS